MFHPKDARDITRNCHPVRLERPGQEVHRFWGGGKVIAMGTRRAMSFSLLHRRAPLVRQQSQKEKKSGTCLAFQALNEATR